MGGDDNPVVLFADSGQHPLAPAPKADVARAIVAHVARKLKR
jgi:phosphopantothenoylcysteine decarboxylase/phosphopantothenate--cysteine ligase